MVLVEIRIGSPRKGAAPLFYYRCKRMQTYHLYYIGLSTFLAAWTYRNREWIPEFCDSWMPLQQVQQERFEKLAREMSDSKELYFDAQKQNNQSGFKRERNLGYLPLEEAGAYSYEGPDSQIQEWRKGVNLHARDHNEHTFRNRGFHRVKEWKGGQKGTDQL